MGSREQLRARVAVHDLGKLLDRLGLLPAEAGGNVDDEAVVDVPAGPRAGAELRRALAAQALDGAVLRAGRDAESLRAMQRRHFDLGAADRLRDRERHLDLDVVALALEHRALLHVGHHEEVAGRAAVAAGLALAGEPHARALLDAGRDVHAVALRRPHDALAMARRARVLDHGAGALAAGARLGDREQPLALRLEAAALAARADLRLGARARAGAVARRAPRRHRDAERHLRALERLVERDVDLGLEIGAALGP